MSEEYWPQPWHPTEAELRVCADINGGECPHVPSPRCPDCMEPGGRHGLVHVRYGNGGGGNRPCPRGVGPQATDPEVER